MDCQMAAAALCETIGPSYGPLVLALLNMLGIVAIYIKSNRTDRTVRATREATDEIKAEVAQTKALVSVRPPPVEVASLTMPDGVPRPAPLPVVTTSSDQGVEP